MLNVHRLICSSVLLCSFQPTEVVATTIEILFPQHYRSTIGVNRFGFGDGDSLFIGANVTPNPRTDPGGPGDSTIVTATQNGTSLTLRQSTSVFNPEFYFSRTPYDPSLTGSWDTKAENSDPLITNSPVNLPTPVVGNTPPAAFVTNMSLSGRLADGFKIGWKSPSISDDTQIGIFLIEANVATAIHDAFLPGGTTSYDIPEVLRSGLSLEDGELYMVCVTNNENRLDGSRLASASSFFEFSPTSESINAFLPTVDQAGVYNFNVTINNANEFIAIDPLVAIGYDFALGAGDPNFSAAMLPFVGDDLFELWLFDTAGVPYLVDDLIAAGELIDFGLNGVDKFRILGIEAEAFLDPTDPTAFVTDVSFVSSGQFTGTMTPITEFVESVPFLLARNQWNQIVFPIQSSARTTRELLIDDFPESSFIYEQDWVLYRYDLLSNDYVLVELDDPLNLGEAYWIIQDMEPSVSIDVPSIYDNSPDTSLSGCPSANGCYALSPNAELGEVRWSMLGAPFIEPTRVSDLRISTDDPTDTCFTAPCDLTESSDSGLTHHSLFHYNPQTGIYDIKNVGEDLSVWQGFWLATLGGHPENSKIELWVPAPE